MSVSKTRILYWRIGHQAEGICQAVLESEQLEEEWQRSVYCGKVARFLMSFPGSDHRAVLRCKEHKEELLEFNRRAVATRL